MINMSVCVPSMHTLPDLPDFCRNIRRNIHSGYLADPGPACYAGQQQCRGSGVFTVNAHLA